VPEPQTSGALPPDDFFNQTNPTSLSKYSLPLPKNHPPQLLPLSTLLAHAPKHTFFLPQLPRRSVLRHLPVLQHQHAIKIRNRAQPVRNHNQRRVRKLLADAALDERVRVHVHRRCGLVEDHDPRARDDGARQAKKLALALRQIEAALGDGGGEVAEGVGVFLGGGADRGAGARRGGWGLGGLVGTDEVDALKTVTELGVGVVVEWIEVGADGSREQDRILRDDGKARAQIVELDGGDVDAVDVDASGASLQEAEERERQ
jgi:hypothetical protein